ncbi:MAG: hypothetical protein QCH35_01655 [Methanomicrobiaceae archaeon]|nr:hypothetical protein [Methanomicrobiaceae archaeon]
MDTGFGWVEIRGERFDHDIILHADKRVTKRKKKKSRDYKGMYGHTPLSEHELELLDAEEPEVVFVGTGQYGDLTLTPGAKQVLSRYSVVLRPTPEILGEIEHEQRRFVAVIHVTC